MTTCYDAGTLRAYLDHELPTAEQSDVDAHLAGCAACQAQLAALNSLDEQVRQRLPAADVARGLQAAAVAEDAALARVQTRLASGAASASKARRTWVKTAPRRPLFAGLAVAAALVLALLVPSVRAAADGLLQIFRVQSVVYVPVSPSRVQQLTHLQVDKGALFLSKPAEVGTPLAPQQVSSLQAGQTLLGFMPQAPTTFPSAPTTTTISVQGQSTYQMQVNVTTLRQILATLGVTNVTIPDALGAQPITIVLPPAVQIVYQGQGYTFTLIEGTSPTVTLPPGVDLAQLGKAALEVYGMTPQQADTLSKQVDWRSTLVFPFPLGTNRIEQVNVQGTQGVYLNVGAAGAQSDTTLVGSNSTQSGSVNGQGSQNTRPNGNWMGLLYWQKGSHFYILTGQGGSIGNAGMLEAANSLR
jgi:hypothetical protein